MLQSLIVGTRDDSMTPTEGCAQCPSGSCVHTNTSQHFLLPPREAKIHEGFKFRLCNNRQVVREQVFKLKSFPMEKILVPEQSWRCGTTAIDSPKHPLLPQHSAVPGMGCRVTPQPLQHLPPACPCLSGCKAWSWGVLTNALLAPTLWFSVTHN